MASKDDKPRRRPMAPPAPANAAQFAESLKRRRESAQGLEQDLLTSVPLLYGSPGSLEPHGDPGVILAQVHQDGLLRRNGGGALSRRSRRSDDPLPFERAMTALAVALALLFFFMS